MYVFVFPMKFSGEFAPLLFINYAYIRTGMRGTSNETVIKGIITSPTMGKQNTQGKEVYCVCSSV